MSNIKNDGTLVDFYQNFIAISRYARWDESKARTKNRRGRTAIPMAVTVDLRY